jgi:SSS family transporter
MNCVRLCLILFVAGIASLLGAESTGADELRWTRAPDLPTPLGLGGPFAGVSNGALIVAGGANFETPPFQGGAKQWRGDVYVLEPDAESWNIGFQLERPLAYGGSVSTNRGFVILGGGDASRHYRDVRLLEWREGSIEQTKLPDLPEACAMTDATLLGSAIYVAGGQAAPDSRRAMKNFWRLDLDAEAPAWERLEPWPGPARILPVVAAQDGAVFVFSGAELVDADDGTTTRRFLTDAYRYRPRDGWERVADAPQPIVAASSVPEGQSHILVFSGDDGELFFQSQALTDRHPGFPKTVRAYHAITDTWTEIGTTPEALVTTTAVRWQDRIVVPSGEDRPGHRTPHVLILETQYQASGFTALDYVCLGAYLAALLAMGFYFSRREKTTADYFLAGRRIPWWAAGISLFGTQLSAITFMAAPAKVYATDWAYFVNVFAIILVSPIVVYFYLPFFRRLNITTAYEYLELRFNPAARLYAGISFILFQFGRMAIVLFLPAMALSAVTGINVFACIIVMGVFSTLYTVLGGIEAVVWTDVLQAVVLLGGGILCLIIMVLGVDGGASTIFEMGMADDKFRMLHWSWDYTAPTVWVLVIGNLFINLVTYTSDQVVVQRYLTTRDEKRAGQSIWLNAAITLPESFIWFLLGTSLYVFYKLTTNLLSPALPTDSIFPHFISQQLPSGVTGIVIAALFAASMSTLDSSLNSVSTVIVTDFHGRFRPQSSDAQRLRLARWLTAVLGAVATATAVAMASYEIQSLWDLFNRMLGLLTSGMAGLFALGMFTRRANGRGALVGAGVSALVIYWVQTQTAVSFFLYAAIGVLTCFVVGYGFSLIFPEDEKGLDGLTIYTQTPGSAPKGA